MHLGVMEFHLPCAGANHHGRQHQAQVAQGLVHAGAHGPLLKQQGIELLPAPLQFRDGVGGGINPHHVAASTLQPAGADLPNRGIPDQGSNREGWLSHGGLVARNGRQRLASILTKGSLKLEDCCLFSNLHASGRMTRG